MDEKQIEKIMKVLSDWNPLGDRAASVADLDGYRTEAVDVLFQINLGTTEKHMPETVRTVLNQAFDLSLDKHECVEPAKQILEIMHNK